MNSFFKEINRRSFDPELLPYVKTWPWLEAGRLLLSKAGLRSMIRHESGPFCLDAVYKSLDRHVSAQIEYVVGQGASALYAYEDGACYSFREAKKYGLGCVYDLPIGYWRTARTMLALEKERWPQYAVTLTGLQDSDEKVARKDEEIHLADTVVVASTFTANSLRDYPGSVRRVEVVPYGFPPVTGERDYASFTGGRKLKLLFVGGLSQRKGIADLFAVAAALKDHVTLTVVGNKVTGDCPQLDQELAKHRWIPSLPHEEVLRLMHQHDVLVFPSLFEGFGLVITEAMSQGTPVITTDRTAGPDLITDGENGFLFEAGSTKRLQDAVERLLHNPDLIASCGIAAREKARQRPWSGYGRELATVIRNEQSLEVLQGNEPRHG